MFFGGAREIRMRTVHMAWQQTCVARARLGYAANAEEI